MLIDHIQPEIKDQSIDMVMTFTIRKKEQLHSINFIDILLRLQ